MLEEIRGSEERDDAISIGLPEQSGSRAILTAMQRASSFVSILACSASVRLFRESRART
jgi:hypothetical protein